MVLNILHQDDSYVAIHKPSGLLVHRSPLDKLETEFAVELLGDQIGQQVHPCHRLDRPTSGVLLFALTSDAARHAQEEFSQRRVKKIYHAVVRGWPLEIGTIDYPLRSEETPEKIDEAVTNYTRVDQVEIGIPIGRYQQARFSLIELRPLTGRKHQLRRHLAHIRHPIIGDTRHGDGAQNRFMREHFDCHRLLLHAEELRIATPSRTSDLVIKADYDPQFYGALEALGLSNEPSGDA
ncbi:MAG: pseudouridine synthase [Lentimonas sp.]